MTAVDLDQLAALARAAQEYEPPWDLVTMDLAPSAREYVRALSPDVVLALIERVRALEAQAEAMRPRHWPGDAAAAEKIGGAG